MDYHQHLKMREQRTCKQDWVLTISIPCGISSSSGGTKGSGGGATTTGRGAGANTVFWTSDVGKELSCWVLYNFDPRKKDTIYIVAFCNLHYNVLVTVRSNNMKSADEC